MPPMRIGQQSILPARRHRILRKRNILLTNATRETLHLGGFATATIGGQKPTEGGLSSASNTSEMSYGIRSFFLPSWNAGCHFSLSPR
jgi:hypothetical protein